MISLCNINLLTSEKIRSIDLLGAIEENSIEKGEQNLVECLSKLSVEGVGTVVKKPQCCRLRFIYIV